MHIKSAGSIILNIGLGWIYSFFLLVQSAVLLQAWWRF